MAYIELVIKIPEEVYKKISNSNPSYADDFPIYYAVKNGTPLPIGHGRLIDENNLWFEDIDDVSCVTQRNVENAPTIIEADKESEEE